MSRECAFCPESAKMSGEHIWSEWMDGLFPGPKRYNRRIAGNSAFIRSSRSLDWTAKVVCKRCNETWMSEIEGNHAKPVMTPLIRGKIGKAGIEIDSPSANSLALFSFKTAVVVDHMRPRTEPHFFSKFVRYGFRECHAIPGSTGIWLTAFEFLGHGFVKSVYNKGRLPTGDGFHLYALTYGVGHLIIQVVSLRPPPPASFAPDGREADKFLAIRIWPWAKSGAMWPPPNILKSPADVDAFGERWNRVIPMMHPRVVKR